MSQDIMRKVSWIMGPSQLIGWGITYYAFSVLLAPVTQSTGWSIGHVNGAFTAALIACALSGLFLGAWFDKHGPQKLMLLAAAFVSILLFTLSVVDDLFAFYLVWIGIGLCMPCIQYDACFWIINHYGKPDSNHRDLALVTFFGGLASTVLIPLTSFLVFTLGWRNTLTALSLIFLAGVGLPFCLVSRALPKKKPTIMAPDSSTSSTRNIVGTSTFWLIAGAMGLSGLAWAALSANILLVASKTGIDAFLVTSIVSTVGIVQVVGRFGFGLVGTRLKSSTIAAILCLLQALAVALLLVLPSPINLIAFIFFFGIGHGVMTPARATLVATCFGSRSFGRVNGAVNFASSLGRAAGPLAFGLALDSTSGPQVALVGAMIASLAAMIALAYLSVRQNPLNHADQPPNSR